MEESDPPPASDHRNCIAHFEGNVKDSLSEITASKYQKAYEYSKAWSQVIKEPERTVAAGTLKLLSGPGPHFIHGQCYARLTNIQAKGGSALYDWCRMQQAKASTQHNTAKQLRSEY